MKKIKELKLRKLKDCPFCRGEAIAYGDQDAVRARSFTIFHKDTKCMFLAMNPLNVRNKIQILGDEWIDMWERRST